MNKQISFILGILFAISAYFQASPTITNPTALVESNSKEFVIVPTTIPTAIPIAYSNGTMFGGPSLYASDIDNILLKRGSPAYGNGQNFFDLGVAYGIDPAYLLAFFAKESSMGADPNWTNTKNIGNIICTSNWQGKCHGRFRIYDSWYAAANDWYKLMSTKYYGMDIYSIMEMYAPSSDGNKPKAYADTVLQLVAQWRTR